MNFIPPELVPGQDNLEALLESETYAAVVEIQSMLDEALDKQLFFTAIGDAHSMVLGLPTSVSNSEDFFFGFSVKMALQSDNWDFQGIEGRLENMQIESDMSLGGGAMPLSIHAYLPILEIWDIQTGLSAGYGTSSFSIMDVNATHHQGWLISLLHWKPSPGTYDLVSFAGLQIQAGLAMGMQNIQTLVKTGLIEETFEYNPLGEGFGPTLSATIQLDPEVDVRFESTHWVLPLSLGAGWKFLESIEIWAGAGVLFAWGENSLGLFGEEEVIVVGNLAELQEQPGRIILEGFNEPTGPRNAQYYGRIQLNLDFESLQIGMPLIIRPDFGISGGLEVGVRL